MLLLLMLFQYEHRCFILNSVMKLFFVFDMRNPGSGRMNFAGRRPKSVRSLFRCLHNAFVLCDQNNGYLALCEKGGKALEAVPE